MTHTCVSVLCNAYDVQQTFHGKFFGRKRVIFLLGLCSDIVLHLHPVVSTTVLSV